VKKKITSKTNIIEELHAKSIDIIALVAATENTFKIKTSPSETSKNKTIGQSVDYIFKLLKEKK
jgi:acyl carrier protein